ncbi:MAG: hypothetical protein QM762_09840 [Chryseolinea sp.]
MNDDEIEDDEIGGIQDLIHYHQREMTRMRKRLDQAKDDHEFEEARSYEREFFRHESKLRLLRTLKDPMFDRRASLYNDLVRTEEMMRDSPHLHHFITQCNLRIKRINEELDEIESKKQSHLETQYIDDAIFELGQGSIQSFRIYLNKREGLVLDFHRGKQSLLIYLRYNKGMLYKSDKRHLRQQGFVTTEEKRTFVREFDNGVFFNAQPVKQMLSAILFDILGHGRFDKNTELIIDRGPDNDETRL